MRHLSLCLFMLAFSTTTAAAQTRDLALNVTAFGGAAAVPGLHGAFGVAVGVKPRPSPVSFEVEFARTRGDSAAGVPAIVTFSGNLLVQVPVRRSRVQVCVTFGVGIYVQQSDRGTSEPNDARNIGGGLKVRLAGPFKLRVDYRKILLSRIVGEYHSNEQRLSVGIVAGF